MSLEEFGKILPLLLCWRFLSRKLAPVWDAIRFPCAMPFILFKLPYFLHPRAHRINRFAIFMLGEFFSKFSLKSKFLLYHLR